MLMSVHVIPSGFTTCFKKRRKTRFAIFVIQSPQDLEVILIDCRSRDDFDKNHIVGAISIPFGNLYSCRQQSLDKIDDPSTHAAISSSVCSVPFESDRHAYLLLYGEESQVQAVYREYQSLPLPLRLLTLQDSFEFFADLFPFITSQHAAVVHGILPICILPRQLYVTSQSNSPFFFLSSRALDASAKKFLSIRSIVDISSHSRGFYSLAEACSEVGTSTISSHCAALLQKGGIAILCDDIYDDLPQILCLYFMVGK